MHDRFHWTSSAGHCGPSGNAPGYDKYPTAGFRIVRGVAAGWLPSPGASAGGCSLGPAASRPIARAHFKKTPLISWVLSLYLGNTLPAIATTRAEEVSVYPGAAWGTRPTEEVGLDASLLDRFAERVGGDGCIVRDGYLVRSWGEVARHGDWDSAAKPVLGTLLLLAVQERRVASVDASVKDLGWGLSAKHAPMTFRHLANMVSGYALDEPPGAAWAYNDCAIQLYAKSLERAFGGSLDSAFCDRMGVLRLEDGVVFGSRNGTRVTASPRDFARLG